MALGLGWRRLPNLMPAPLWPERDGLLNEKIGSDGGMKSKSAFEFEEMGSCGGMKSKSTFEFEEIGSCGGMRSKSAFEFE